MRREKKNKRKKRLSTFAYTLVRTLMKVFKSVSDSSDSLVILHENEKHESSEIMRLRK